MKSESGFSFAIASQPFLIKLQLRNFHHTLAAKSGLNFSSRKFTIFQLQNHDQTSVQYLHWTSASKSLSWTSVTQLRLNFIWPIVSRTMTLLVENRTLLLTKRHQPKGSFYRLCWALEPCTCFVFMWICRRVTKSNFRNIDTQTNIHSKCYFII